MNINEEDYLKHVGVLGMRWGHRSSANRVGITKKRQDAYDNRGLKRLSEGGHLSTGFTKKRQEAYDKRDKVVLEKRIAKNTLALGKDATTNWLKEAGKLTMSQLVHPIISGAATKASLNSDTIGVQLKRQLLWQSTKDLQDVNKRIASML